jgi:hypothetical protein
MRSMMAASSSFGSSGFFGRAMLFPETEDDWDLGVISPAYAQALGIFTAYYNLLETEMVRLVGVYLPTTRPVRELAYFGMSNRQRMDFILALAKAHEKNAAILKATRHLVACFEECVQNRNILVHSVHGRREARKRASDDASKEVTFDLSLQRLRQAAEGTMRTYFFLLEVIGWHEDQKRPEQLGLPGFGARFEPLPEIPPRPGRLNPRQLGPAPGNKKRPPRSSRA